MGQDKLQKLALALQTTPEQLLGWEKRSMPSVINERIRARREELGMSQLDLAKRIGYTTKGAVSHLESGDRDIRQGMLMKLSDALGVSIEWLLYGDGAVYPAPSALTDSEMELLKEFRHLSEERQALVLEVIKAL